MNRLRLLLAGISFILTLAMPSLAAADVNDFIINSFQADETLSRADRQGELHVVERINLTYHDYNHGILRAIPKRYNGHSLQLKINKVGSDSGAPNKYSTYTSNGNLVLKIGDPNKTITGSQEYTIDYTVRNVISFNKGHDELYWDVNGDQWQQEFTQVAVNLHLPGDLKLASDPVCYTGSFGSTSQDCRVINPQNSDISALTTRALQPYQTLTYRADFEKGYFRPSTRLETIGEYWQAIAGFALPTLLIGGAGFSYWLRKGRDPKGRGVIVPQYDPPDKLDPLAVGTLLDFKADQADITSVIVDLAVRRYLKIIETKEVRALRKDKLHYSLELVNPDPAGLSASEADLLNALFEKLEAGSTVDITSIKDNTAKREQLYGTVKNIKKRAKNQLKSDGYLQSPRLSGSAWKQILVWASILISSFIIIGSGVITGLVAGTIIAAIFLTFIDARTAKGVEAKEHILGLKMYLDVAEKQRLEKLQGPDAAYAANAGEPAKTVELFEKLLPYAMVLGVEQQWAKQFESLYTTPPEWYSGNWTSFNSGYLVGSLNSGIGSAVNTAFSSPSSSSGGGGGAGGGGGGGGGGGW